MKPIKILQNSRGGHNFPYSQYLLPYLHSANLQTPLGVRCTDVLHGTTIGVTYKGRKFVIFVCYLVLKLNPTSLQTLRTSGQFEHCKGRCRKVRRELTETRECIPFKCCDRCVLIARKRHLGSARESIHQSGVLQNSVVDGTFG